MHDVIIIGGGPSGLTAALNLRRSGKSVLLFENEGVGGQIAESPRVENLPSFKEVEGAEFISSFFDQILDNYGLDYELEKVIKLEKNNDIFKVTTDFKNRQYEAKSVIIATGVKHRKFNIPNEDNLIGKGISFCAVCDGAFYKDEDVCLVGDANTALQYALHLSGYCKHVYLYTLFDKFFGDQIYVDRLKDKPNIIIKHNLSLKEIIGKDKLESLVFTNTKTKVDESLTVKGLFIAIGQIPSNDIFKEFVDLNKGFIVVNHKMETKTPGLYAIGDCTDKLIRQVTTACNDGAVAAFYCNEFLK